MAYVTNLPLNGKLSVTAFYGQTGAYWNGYHKGIDFISDNTAVYSICDGTVTVVGWDKNGWGRYVSIKPEGFERVRFILCHLVENSTKLKVGDKVTRTTKIGIMGSTGNSSGAHVHAEMRIDNTPVDISQYLLIPNRKTSNLLDTDFKFDAACQASLLERIIEEFDGKQTESSSAKKIAELEKKLAAAEEKIKNAKLALE